MRYLAAILLLCVAAPAQIINPGGSGSVTHTSGALTSGKCVIGNGTGDLKVDASCSSDGSGNYAVTSLKVSTEYDNGTCTTAATVSAANGNRQKITLTNGDTCALTFTQPSSGTISVQLKVIQSSVSTFNGGISGCKWPAGTTPTITATSAAVDIVTIYMDGTNAYCVATQDFR